MTAAPALTVAGCTWSLAHPARPKPMNAYRTLHHYARAAYDAEWRGIFHLLAIEQHLPRLGLVHITVAQQCRRLPLPDPGANYPTAKAAIDGLCDAGVLDDDTGTHVTEVAFVAPIKGHADVFALIIEELV